MSLRDIAAADLLSIVTDTSGFSAPVTVTNPAGTSAILYGLVQDIGFRLDPDTGMPVAGRQASVALSIASLTANGLSEPAPVPDESSKPWTIVFDSKTFTVQEARPDRGAGLIVLMLESYKPL